jgi:hypothetical protein
MIRAFSLGWAKIAVVRYRSYRIAGTSGMAGTVRLWNGVAPTVHSTSEFFMCQRFFRIQCDNVCRCRSFWTLTGSPSLLSHPATTAIAKANNCSPPQTVYRFVQSLGITPLCGTTDEAHMRDDITAENLDKGEGHFGTLAQFIWG